MRKGPVIILLFLSIIGLVKPLKAQVIEQDSLALIDFFISTSGDDWLIPWDTAQEVNEWFGVALTEDNSRVAGITLPNNQLTGQVSISISNLEKLSTLVLSDNQISGKVPSILGTLDTLIVLDLSGNLFTDTIPVEIGSLSLLKTLDLSGNELQGNIPSSLGNLDSLRILNLSQNQLSGSIPPSLGNLDSLNTINLSFNLLDGDVPDFLQQLNILREIDLSSNLLAGTLPVFWDQFINLRTLRLNNNQIEGAIPNEIGTLNRLFTLNLSENLFDGPIPSGIVDMDSLRVLDLSGNLLDEIPSTIYQLSKLQRLDLSENVFTGALPIFFQIPGQMEILDLHGNTFSGSIPSNYGLINSLKTLDLSGNDLVDSLPQSFLGLNELEQLNISNNQLTGLLDVSELGVSGSLQQLDVKNNKLGFEDLEPNILLFNDSTDYSPQARINDTLNVAVPTGNMYTLLIEAEGNANKYRWVLESEDSLIQSIYAPENFELLIEDFQEENSGSYTCEVISDLVPGLTLNRNAINLFPAINTIDSLVLIEFNKATGGDNWINKWNILADPVFTWEGVDIASGVVVGLSLENNNLEGVLTDSIGHLENLLILDLSGNSLTDSLPASFINLEKLRELDLANNNFNGEIPKGLSNMDSLIRVNLSRNQFEGNLNNRFDSLLFLKELDLSDNDLSGEIPIGISSLLSLEILALGENRLTGSIPVELGGLEDLLILDLSENRLTGEIPAELSDLTKLQELKLFRNQLSGTLSEDFTGSLSLERLFINDNRVNSLPIFSNFQFNNLELRVFNNELTFDDFVNNYNGFNNVGREDEFLFLPQPTIANKGTQTLQKDDSTVIVIPDTHTDNRYRWFKDGTALGIETRELTIDSASIGSSGIYLGQVWTTNSNFRDEINTLNDSLVFSFNYTILVAPPVPDVSEPEPFCIGDETISLINDFGGQSGLVSRWYRTHPSSGGMPFSENPNIIYSIENESDTVYVTNGLSFDRNFESFPDTLVIISRPWIEDRGNILEVAPSDSLLNTRFQENNVTSSYQWFRNGSLVSGETGSIIQKSTMDAIYNVRIIRGGCSSTSLEYVPPNENLVLSINDEWESEISIYPNPVLNNLNIKGTENIPEVIEVSIIDMKGVVIINTPARFETDFSQSINTTSLHPGIYLVRIKTEKNPPYTLRIIKE